MPLSEEVLGTEADGSKSEEYCIYCYKDGAFTGDFTMEEMVDFCSHFVEEYNKNTGNNLNREEYPKIRKIVPAIAFESACSNSHEHEQGSSRDFNPMKHFTPFPPTCDWAAGCVCPRRMGDYPYSANRSI